MNGTVNMKSMTYAEALKIGFSEKEAQFFARLAFKSCNEEIDQMEHQNKARAGRTDIINRALVSFMCIAFGMGAGVLVSALGWVK